MKYLTLITFLMVHSVSEIKGQHAYESRYVVYHTPMTWPEARDTCQQDDGFLADIHPEVSHELRKLLTNSPEQPYWIGKSLSPWVILRGCVKWKGPSDLSAVYNNSKYNQMTECATACMGSTSFLLQSKSCYCLNKVDNQSVTNVPYIKCNGYCPGMSRDKCGGSNVFTFYEYYHNKVIGGNKMYNCVCKNSSFFIQRNCSTNKGFTCELTNGSKMSYKEDVPGKDISLNFNAAVEFCSKHHKGLRMSPIPEFHLPYLQQEYWTTVIRAVDWNFNTVSEGSPEFSGTFSFDKDGQFKEQFRETSEKYGAVCQYDDVTMETYTETDGNISSPDYPQTYKHNQLYKWNMTFNNSIEIQLVFENIDLEDSKGCIYDYIKVIENNEIVEKFCGKYKQKRILVRSKIVSIVFRSDKSISGTGFTMYWSEAANEGILTSSQQNTLTDRSLSGGTIVGITVAAATVSFILAGFLVCLIYRKTHQKRAGIITEELSNVHNMAYAVSSSNTGSSGNIYDIDNTYLTAAHTSDKQFLQAETSIDTGGKQAPHYEIKEEDNYLNAGLASNVRSHYDDIESPKHDQYYSQVDKTKKSAQQENSADNEYIEFSNI